MMLINNYFFLFIYLFIYFVNMKMHWSPWGTPYLLTILVLKLEIMSLFYCPLMYLKYCFMYGKQCWPWSDAASCGVWSGSTLFAKVYLFQYLGLLQYDIAWDSLHSIEISVFFVWGNSQCTFICLYPKFWDISTLHHTCRKLLNKLRCHAHF